MFGYPVSMFLTQKVCKLTKEIQKKSGFVNVTGESAFEQSHFAFSGGNAHL